MKKFLSLTVMFVAFAHFAIAQTYTPIYSTKLVLKNGSKLTINPPAFGADESWTLPAANAAGVLTNDGTGGLSWAAGSLLSGGTNNVVTKWTGATTVGTSTITDDGTDVSTTSNLKLTGSNKLLSFKGNSTGVTTFVAGTQGATSINYTLPTTAPTINQTLTATAVSGSDVTLGWSSSNSFGLFELEDDSVTNDDDALYDCDNLQASLASSSNYAIEAFLYYRTDGHDGADIRMAFTYTGSLATDGMHLSGRGAADAESEEEIWTASGTATVTNINQDQDAYIHIVGFVRTSTAGTLKVQFANGTEGSGRVTVLKGGSYMKVTKF